MLQNLKVPANAGLITLDIENLYTNISHSDAITVFLKTLKNHPNKVFVLDLLKYVLKSNVSNFDELIFTQVCGISMGTKMAPALATIFVRDLKETFLQEHSKKPLLWVRYIDDVFSIWMYPLNEFYDFLDTSTKLIPTSILQTKCLQNLMIS